MNRTTQRFSEQIDRLKAAISKADAVIIGAGSGLPGSGRLFLLSKRTVKK